MARSPADGLRARQGDPALTDERSTDPEIPSDTEQVEEATRTVHGRGAGFNPVNRFERLTYAPEEEPADRIGTTLLRDASKSVLAENRSPDVPFTYSLNPYRGCEHGCAYCYARPTHEYLGFSAGLDFETKILVKEDAPELLTRQLMKPSWEPQPIAMSGNTDPYQPIERKLELTRRCLQVLSRYRNPVQIITKNALVQRDLDILSDLAEDHAAGVAVSITTLETDLVRKLEPRTSSPLRRLETVRALRHAGVQTTVLIAPVIPGITDHELPKIVEACAEAGAQSVGYILLRLPLAVAPLFEDWLERHFPDRKRKVLHKLEQLRDGRLNDPRFGHRMRGTGPLADHIRNVFQVSARRHGLDRPTAPLSTAAFRRPGQMSLL